MDGHACAKMYIRAISEFVHVPKRGCELPFKGEVTDPWEYPFHGCPRALEAV